MTPVSREECEKAIRKIIPYGVVATPSAISDAADALGALWTTASQQGLRPEDLLIAGDVLGAQKYAYKRQTDNVVDPAELVVEAGRSAAVQLGQEPEGLILDCASGQGVLGSYVVLARQEETPPLGPTGSAPLVVRLAREWEWTVFADIAGGSSEVSTIIAPPPSLRVAAEIGRIAADVLTGRTLLGQQRP